MAGKFIEMLVPTAEPRTKPKGLAPRLDSLDGKTIGILDNRWNTYVVFLNRLEQRLRSQFPTATPIRKTKMTKSVGATAEMIDEMATGCQGVINGLGG